MNRLIQPRRRQLILPDGRAELCYQLFTGRRDNRQIYSLYVTLVRDSHAESDFVFDIARSREASAGLLDLLFRNTVTPCTLREVLSELL